MFGEVQFKFKLYKNPGAVSLLNWKIPEVFWAWESPFQPRPPLENHQVVLGRQEKQPRFISTWPSQFSREKRTSSPYLIRAKEKRSSLQFLSWMKKMSQWLGTGDGGEQRDRNHLNKQSLNQICYENFFHKQVWVLVTQLCTNLQPHGPATFAIPCNPPGSSVHGIFQARILGYSSGAIPFSMGVPNKGIKFRFPALQADTSLSESHIKSIEFGLCICESYFQEKRYIYSKQVFKF